MNKSESFVVKGEIGDFLPNQLGRNWQTQGRHTKWLSYFFRKL